MRLRVEPAQVLHPHLPAHQDYGADWQSQVALLRASPWAPTLRGSSAAIRGAGGLHRVLVGSSSCWASAGRMRITAASSRQSQPASAGDVCDEFYKDKVFILCSRAAGGTPTPRADAGHVVLGRWPDGFSDHMFSLWYVKSVIVHTDIHTEGVSTGTVLVGSRVQADYPPLPGQLRPGFLVNELSMLFEHVGGVAFDYWASYFWTSQAAERGPVSLGEGLLRSADSLSAGRRLPSSSCSSASVLLAAYGAAPASLTKGSFARSSPWTGLLSRVVLLRLRLVRRLALQK